MHACIYREKYVTDPQKVISKKKKKIRPPSHTQKANGQNPEENTILTK